ncbi:MAG: LysM peptidoglycan-binding domain-containing protein [Pirellulales bacterium]|nr:LysM peptidoglycan-binding domain-containing protein [Pirellulales bacterium]
MSLMTRLSVVGLVLAVGIGSAMLFRKDKPEAVDGAHKSPDALLLRKSPSSASSPKATVVSDADRSSNKPPTEVSVLRRDTPGASTQPKTLPPPEIENTFARPFVPSRSNEAAKEPEPRDHEVLRPLPATSEDRDSRAESGDPPGPRVRIVVDGDSLRSLAKRYLGDSDRYMEIYEANRDVLTSPDLLVIGMKLKIPTAKPQPITEKTSPAKPKMVPIK